MTLTAQASIDVATSPETILDFVLDLEKYQEVDAKFVRVGKVEGPNAEGRGSVSMWGRIGWLPPAPDRQDFVLDPGKSLTFTGAPRQPARLIFDFLGTFECKPVDGGTTITHGYEFRFKGPFRLVERPLAGWLQRQIDDEVQQLAARFTD